MHDVQGVFFIARRMLWNYLNRRRVFPLKLYRSRILKQTIENW
jgi:hypothetical protein